MKLTKFHRVICWVIRHDRGQDKVIMLDGLAAVMLVFAAVYGLESVGSGVFRSSLGDTGRPPCLA